MATPQELAVRDKKELVSKEEKTVPGRYYVPYGDIYETDEALTVVLEMPGVEKKDLEVALENDVLRVDGRIDFSKYEGMEPLYTEYNVGHYARRSLSGDAQNRLRAPFGRQSLQDRKIRQRWGFVAFHRCTTVVFSVGDRGGYVLILNGIGDQLMHHLVHLLDVLRIEQSPPKIDLSEVQRLQYHLVVNMG